MLDCFSTEFYGAVWACRQVLQHPLVNILMLTTFIEFEFPEVGLVPVHVVNDRLALGRFRHSLHDQFISLWVAGLAVAQLDDGSTVLV